MTGTSAVVAQQHLGLLGQGANQKNLLPSLCNGENAVVLEQYHRLVCDGARQSPVLGTVEELFINFGEGHHPRRIEHAELDPGREEPHQRKIQFALFQETLLHSVDVGVIVAVVIHFLVGIALIVHAPLDRKRGAFGSRLHEVVVAGNVDDRIAVRYDVPLEAPFPTQLVFKKEAARAGRFSINSVIGAHHRSRFAFSDGSAECGKIGVKLVVSADVEVVAMSRGLRATMNRVVLGRGEVVVPRGAKAMAMFTNTTEKSPAITVNNYGKGQAIYVAVPSQVSVLAPLVRGLYSELGIEKGPETPAGVYARVVEKRTLYVKTTDEEKTIPIHGSKRGLVSGASYADLVRLKPYGVDLVE